MRDEVVTNDSMRRREGLRLKSVQKTLLKKHAKDALETFSNAHQFLTQVADDNAQVSEESLGRESVSRFLSAGADDRVGSE